MDVNTQILVDNLEDLAVIAWYRAVVLRQPITVRCPNPKTFVPTMLQINSPSMDISRLSIKEAINLIDMAKLVENSSLELEVADTLSYFYRA